MADEETKEEVEETEEAKADSEDAEQAEEKPEPKKSPKLKKKPMMMLATVIMQVIVAYTVAQFLILPRLPATGDGADSTSLAQTEPAEEIERGSIIMMDDVNQIVG